MTDTNQLPPHTITIHDHPEPWIMQWSDLELAAVKRYAEQYALQARAILALRPERVPMTDEQRRLAFLASRAGHGHTAFMLGIQFAEAHHDIKPKEKV